MPFSRAFADAGNDRDPGVALNGAANQLHNEHGPANACPTEHGGLATAYERGQQVDDLNASMKDLARAALADERGRVRMDGPASDIKRQGGTSVHRLADCVEE